MRQRAGTVALKAYDQSAVDESTRKIARRSSALGEVKGPIPPSTRIDRYCVMRVLTSTRPRVSTSMRIHMRLIDIMELTSKTVADRRGPPAPPRRQRDGGSSR